MQVYDINTAQLWEPGSCKNHHKHLLMIRNKQYLIHSFLPCQLNEGYFLIMFLPSSSCSLAFLIIAFFDLKYPTIWSIASSQTYSMFFSLLRAASTLGENHGIENVHFDLSIYCANVLSISSVCTYPGIGFGVPFLIQMYNQWIIHLHSNTFKHFQKTSQ